MAGKIKCTYEDCFKHFKTRESMFQHKVKDPAHDYCRRCNVDCEDDMDYLIHQMGNPRHIACCICGDEFKSEAGRDSHVELFHQRAQDIECVGCKDKFTRVHALMAHIERNECSVITSDAFERQRAEKQIEKDAWAEALDSNKGSYLPSQSGASDGDSQGVGGVSLLDNDQSYFSGNWHGVSPQSSGPQPLQPSTRNARYTAPKPLVQSIGALSLDKFPSLSAQNKKTATTEQSKKADIDPNLDLLDFTEEEHKPMPSASPWNSATMPSTVFPRAGNSFLKVIDSSTSSSINGSSNVSPGTLPNPPMRMFDRLSQLSTANSNALHPAARPPSVDSNIIPPAAKSENIDPNAPHFTILTAPSITPPSTLNPQSYYDTFTATYVCPGAKCGQKFTEPAAFHDHLLTGAHVGGRTACPSCLKKFNTTTSLIAHCESGTRKCTIRKSTNYDQVMRELTGGLIGTSGHLVDGSVRYVANKVQDW